MDEVSIKGRCRWCGKETLMVSLKRRKNGFISMHKKCTECMTGSSRSV